MPQYTLTVLDVTGIQDYIFGSNRVPENVGASQLVHQATGAWVRESMNEAEVRHNLMPDDTIDASRSLETDETLDAEVILRGGGNVLILFRTPECAEVPECTKVPKLAKATVSKLTRKLLTAAPGLEIAVAHHTFDWITPIGGPKEHGAHRELYQKLNQTKQQRRSSAPLLGLGVTVECRATGMPAVAYEGDRPVSAEVKAKLGQQGAAESRLKTMVAGVADGYTFRRDFGALGGTEGEMSYIAVVHADGNGMGKRFEDVLTRFPNATDNRACLNALRDLSEAVDRAGQTALCETVRRMTVAFQSEKPSAALQRFLAGLSEHAGKPVIPFRPILYGGDDVTFVCDGRLGLALAAIYLEEWERATQAATTIGQAYACAGVAMVKSHYPFVRAYHLASDLCAGAKQAIRVVRSANPTTDDASALDWHFAMSGITGKIGEIRKREYSVKKREDLTLRPLMLSAPIFNPAWRTWDTFDRVTREFQAGECWRKRRNKVKALREVLRQGSDAVSQFRHAFTLPTLPPIDSSQLALQEGGWAGELCGYFDMIEALDFYLPLTEVR